MKKVKLSASINQFEQEKLCHLLECSNDELNKLYDTVKTVINESNSTYDTMLNILQQGNNVREATLIGVLCGKLIGFSEAEAKIEEEIKEKLFNAFKSRRPLH